MRYSLVDDDRREAFPGGRSPDLQGADKRSTNERRRSVLGQKT